MPAKPVLDTLLFVDTNVLLDFYRIRKTDVSTKYLEQIEACRDRLIIGTQIEMEYKKNRQRVILEALANYGTPDWGKLSAPALVADHQAVKMVDKKKKELMTQKAKVDEKIRKVLSDPIHHDPVYQCLQRLFKNNSPFNLSREKKGKVSNPTPRKEAVCTWLPSQKASGHVYRRRS
jgi:hypothetical protein